MDQKLPRHRTILATFQGQSSTILWGITATAVAFWFWLYANGNPLQELALIQKGRTIPGSIVGAWEEPQDGDEGTTHWFSSAVYNYKLPDGREFTAATRARSGRLKPEFRGLKAYPLEVEYLPNNPQVSRIKGHGCQSVIEFLWRRLGLGGLVLALLLSPAFVLFRNAIQPNKQCAVGKQSARAVGKQSAR